MQNEINSILQENHAGSVIIARRALQLYLKLVRESAGRKEYPDQLYQTLQETSKVLIKGQPNMALIRRNANNLLLYLKRLIRSTKDFDEVFEAAQNKIRSIEAEIEHNIERIAQFGAKVIAPMNKIMTISNSTMVQHVFLTAEAQKRRFEVFCLKSHPPDEGIDLAEFLAGRGLAVTLIADAEMASFIPHMNLVMIGADRLVADGFVNKSGSLPLCLTARYFNIPVYMACETAKILSEKERSIKFHPRNASEVYQGNSPGLAVQNIYYEKIPLNLVHKIICEEGVFETKEFINWHLKE
jgi:translation initiation factor 2B subunit (eIF-2B alpha/beta/delta family)